jgi:hypothetical protein
MKKYEGPPKPIPTYREPLPDSMLALWFAALAAFLVIFLYLE